MVQIVCWGTRATKSELLLGPELPAGSACHGNTNVIARVQVKKKTLEGQSYLSMIKTYQNTSTLNSWNRLPGNVSTLQTSPGLACKAVGRCAEPRIHPAIYAVLRSLQPPEIMPRYDRYDL